ncbi:MAG: EF-hand domain-containing protein [Alphaproteobacteria bacterium]|nr:EF-hand domain-containing protein [Alphaproteobacteria bacterium]
MKKLMMMTAAFAVLGAPVALADHHEGGDHKGKMMEKFDADGNGAISKEEFMKSSEDRFNKMDTDGNGEISKEEAQAMKDKMREKMKERMETRKEHRSEHSDDASHE